MLTGLLTAGKSTHDLDERTLSNASDFGIRYFQIFFGHADLV